MDGHIDQTLAENEADMGLRLREERLERFVERGVVARRRREEVVGNGFYRDVFLCLQSDMGSSGNALTTHVVEVHIEHRKQREWVALDPVRFDGRANCRL